MAIIRCYRDFYMPKMASFHRYPDEFRRRYMLSSMKLIMKSSFIVKKLGHLGIPEAMQKVIEGAKSPQAKCPHAKSRHAKSSPAKSSPAKSPIAEAAS